MKKVANKVKNNRQNCEQYKGPYFQHRFSLICRFY